jgi:hypothetical protein
MKSSAYRLVDQILEFDREQEFPQPEIISRQGDFVLYKAVDALTVRWLSQGISSRYVDQSHWWTCQLDYAFKYARKGPVYFVYRKGKPYVLVSFARKEIENVYGNFPSSKTIQEIRPLFSNRQKFPLEIINRIPELLENFQIKSPQSEIIGRQGDLVLYKVTDAETVRRLSRGIFSKCKVRGNWCTRDYVSACSYVRKGPVYFVYKNNQPYIIISFAAREMENVHSDFPNVQTIREIRPLFSNRQEFPLRIMNRIPDLLESPQPEVVSRQGDLVLYRTTNALTINRLSRGIFSGHGDQSNWSTRDMYYATICAKNDPVYFVYKKDKPYVFVSFARKEIKDIYTRFPSLKTTQEIRPLFSNRQKFPLEVIKQIPELIRERKL